jgi:hypothetical protein
MLPLSSMSTPKIGCGNAGPVQPQDDLRRPVIPRHATWDRGAGAEGAAKRQVASETGRLLTRSRARPTRSPTRRCRGWHRWAS